LAGDRNLYIFLRKSRIVDLFSASRVSVVAGINLSSVKYFYKKIAEGKIIIKRSGTNYYFTTVPLRGF
jgi:hypothetical protein